MPDIRSTTHGVEVSASTHRRCEDFTPDISVGEALAQLYEIASSDHIPVSGRAYTELCLQVARLVERDVEAGRDALVSSLSEEAWSELSGSGGVTDIETVGSILRIRDERSRYSAANGETRWRRDVWRVPGPVTETTFRLCSSSLRDGPAKWAEAAEALALHGDLSKLDALRLNNQQGTTQDTGQHTSNHHTTTTTDGHKDDGRRAIEPVTAQGERLDAGTVELVSYVAEGRFNGVGPVLSRPYTSARSPYTSARSGGFYATKQRVDLLPVAEIEGLLDRAPDGQLFPWVDVPTELYERIVEWAPAVAEAEPLAAILQHNLLAHGRDDDWYREGDNVGIVIPHEKIFAAFGMAPSTGWHRGINSAMLLEIYRRKVDPGFRWTGWNDENGKARVTKSHRIPHDIIQDAKELMLSPEDYDDWTYLVSGKSANSRRWTRTLREERRELIEANEPVIEPPEATRQIQDYLNSLPQQYFGHGAHGNLRPKQLDKAIWTVADTINEEERRDQELRKLYWMRKFPQPLYLPCDRFPRLKADHHNQAMNLPSAVLRSTYTPRDYELDLSKAHLASYVPVAKREGLEVPTLERYLDANLEGDTGLLAGGDLWLDLASTLDLEGPQSAQRKAVKRAYSAVYGSSRQNLLYQIYTEYAKLTGTYLENFDPLEPLLSHPLMEELLQTRDKLEAVITERGGLKDATGRFIPLSAWDETKDQENRWRGCMAYVNASYEQEIMAPIFRQGFDERTRDGKTRFRVWLYQADGATVRVHRDYAHSPQIERLQSAVAERAEELGVPTELEVDHTPDR